MTVSPPAPSSVPERPRVFNGSTTHGPRGIRPLRHPAEIPLLWVSTAVTATGILAGLALAVWLITVPDSTGLAGNVRNYLVSTGTTKNLLAIPLLPLSVWILRAFLYARQRARSVQMSPTQFPEGYRMVVEAAARFGMRRVPDAYVVLGNGVVNAFAAGHGFRRFVVVQSDLFEIGGSARDPEALRFVISHEVGHLAAGHVSYWRTLILQVVEFVPLLGRALSRAQEYTADNHGYDIAPAGVPGVMGLLGAGKYLGAQVNLHALADRAVYEHGVWVHLVQWVATHPILTWRAYALRDRRSPGRLMARPKAAWYPPVSPVGRASSANWPSPAQVLSVLRSTRVRVPGAEEQFGRYPGVTYAVGPNALRLADPVPVPLDSSDRGGAAG